MLSIAVLGEVEVLRDGERLPVPAGKTTELLVRLALDAGSRVRADALLDELWTEAAGRNTLQSKVSQLRRALGDRHLVAATADGYTLAVEPRCVDAFLVVALAAQTDAARAANEPAAVLALAREGLALFRGEVLVDAGDWATPHRVRLEETRLGLLEDAMAARIDLGSGGELVGELEALVEQHPLRERLWASLVTALYRSGRQADALAAYARVRRLLVEELGIEPGPRLRELERQVLEQSPGLEGREPVRAAAPGNLPPVPGPLVGREKEVGELGSLVAQHRLVTVTGPAGVGKTRLAVEVAHTLAAPGGAWLVRLEAADDSASMAGLLAETLHVPGGEEALGERLAGADTVLLLDSCEHVVRTVADLVGTLLESVPRLRVLATSQLPLGVDGEHLLQLDPLSMPDSVALFVRRARDLRPLVDDADTRRLVEEVCGSLDGLPLAIELAAARVRSLSLRDIARRLDDRFAILQDPSSRRPARRRALAGAIGWSYDLLFPDDQIGLWALSCFAGSASLDALEQVVAALGVPTATVMDSVTRLVDRSLVTVDVAADGGVRYRLLDSVRAYASDRLRDAGRTAVASAAHAGWYAELAQWCDDHVRGDRQPECVALVVAERANIDAALAWAASHDPALGVRIANGFGWTWVVLGDGTTGAARVRAALTPSTPERDRATGLLLSAWLEASAGDVDLAQQDLDDVGRIADRLGDDVMRADVLLHQAFVSIQQGRPDDVVASSAASIAVHRDQSLDWSVACGLLLSAYGLLMLGDTAQARRSAEGALEIVSPIGDAWGLVHAEAMLGGIAQAERRFPDAIGSLTRAAQASRDLGFTGQAALHLASLARVQHRSGDLDGAAATYEEAIAAALAGGDHRLAATARLHLAGLLRARGRSAEAVALLEESDRWYALAGGGEGALLTRCLLHAEALDVDRLAAVLEEAGGTGNAEVRVYALDALALAAAGRGDGPRARSLIEESDLLAATVVHLVDDADRVDRARALDR